MATEGWENWRKLRSPRRPLARFLLRWPTVALVLALAAIVATSRYWQPLVVGWRVDRLLERATADDAAVLLRQTLELGRPGMEVVVKQLGSRRQVIRRLAEQTLATEIASWPQRPADEAARRSLQLAEALAGQVDRLSPVARLHAVELARDIMQRSGRQPAAENVALTAACRHVLARAARGRTLDTSENFAAEPGSTGTDGYNDSMLHRTDLASDGSVGGDTVAARAQSGQPAEPYSADSGVSEQIAPLPGGAIPFGPLPGPPLSAGEVQLTQPAEPPRLLEMERPVKPLRAPSLHGADRVDRTANIEAEGARAAPDEAPLPPALVSYQSPTSIDGDGHAESRDPSQVVQWLSKLHDADERVVVDARRRLSQQGFTPRQIEVGMHLTAPDAGERRRWAEMLPRLSGIEAKPWLLWLSRDRDADVRRAAVSLMATTSDPQMLARVRQLAGEDEDARVRELAARVGDTSRGSGGTQGGTP